MAGGKGKNNSKNKKRKLEATKKVKAAVNIIDTVVPVSTPVGSVHFDEFLKICCEPPKPVEPVIEASKPVAKGNRKKGAKGKKGTKSKKGAKNKKEAKGKKGTKGKQKQAVEKLVELPPTDETNDYPPLFPLIKALLMPAEGDVLDNTALFSVSIIYLQH